MIALSQIATGNPTLAVVETASLALGVSIVVR
jgi:hypothetical protein